MANNPVSMLVCVGEANYRLHEVIDEYQAIGVSKRIALTAIPEGMEKGISKVLVAHPKAIVKVKEPGHSILDLAYDLNSAGYLPDEQWNAIVELGVKPFWEGQELKAEDFVPREMLYVTYALSLLSATNSDDYMEVHGAYDLEYCMGVIGYSPFSGFQVVLGNDETDLPADLENLRPLVNLGYVEMVHVQYEDEEEDTGVEEED